MTDTKQSKTIAGYIKQAWRDLLSIYYTNTPAWRWMKSGALFFMAFFLWTGSSVMLSVKPGWTFLHYSMAYGFVLILWGPLTHLAIVPLTIRLRRTAKHPLVRKAAINSGRLNITVFLLLVVLVGTFAPGTIMLGFSPSDGGNAGEPNVNGDVVCDFNDVISCHVEDGQGIDHVAVVSDGEVIATADEPPFEVEFDRDDVAETRTGPEFQVQFRDENDQILRRFVRTVPDPSG